MMNDFNESYIFQTLVTYLIIYVNHLPLLGTPEAVPGHIEYPRLPKRIPARFTARVIS